MTGNRPQRTSRPHRQREYYQPPSFRHVPQGINKRPSERPPHLPLPAQHIEAPMPSEIQAAAALPPKAAAEAYFDNDTERFGLLPEDLHKKAKDWESRAARASNAWRGEYSGHLSMLYRTLASNREERAQHIQDLADKKNAEEEAEKKAKEAAEAKERVEGRKTAEMKMEAWEMYDLPTEWLEDQLYTYEKKLEAARTPYKKGYYRMKVHRFRMLLNLDVKDDGFLSVEDSPAEEGMETGVEAVSGGVLAGEVGADAGEAGKAAAGTRVSFSLNSGKKRRRLD